MLMRTARPITAWRHAQHSVGVGIKRPLDASPASCMASVTVRAVGNCARSRVAPRHIAAASAQLL